MRTDSQEPDVLVFPFFLWQERGAERERRDRDAPSL